MQKHRKIEWMVQTGLSSATVQEVLANGLAAFVGGLEGTREVGSKVNLLAVLHARLENTGNSLASLGLGVFKPINKQINNRRGQLSIQFPMTTVLTRAVKSLASLAAVSSLKRAAVYLPQRDMSSAATRVAAAAVARVEKRMMN